MPKCYLLLISKGSSVDATTNNFTLYSLVEEVASQIVGEGEAPEGLIPADLEIHSYWMLAPHELNQEFEIRFFYKPVDGEPIVLDKIFRITSDKLRQRLRIQGIGLPPSGVYELRCEWRQKGSIEWNIENPFWPITSKSSYRKLQLKLKET